MIRASRARTPTPGPSSTCNPCSPSSRRESRSPPMGRTGRGDASLARPASGTALHDLLNFMVEEQIHKDPHPHEPARRSATLVALADRPRPRPAEGRPEIVELVARDPRHGQSRADGSPSPDLDDPRREAKHYPGHHNDYLYFNVPLRAISRSLRPHLVPAGARPSSPTRQNDPGHYDSETTTSGRTTARPPGTIAPPLPAPKDYYPFKIVVKNGD